MRIVHVATYVSIDGAFGGPLAVARSLTGELARRGHEVQLIAGWDGRAQLEVPGVQVRLIRARRVGGRLATLTSPSLWSAVARAARHADVVHLHMGRDFVTLGAAAALMRSRTPSFIQPHGMVIPDVRAVVRILDRLLTRSVLARAAAVLALTPLEEVQLRTVAGSSVRVERLNNGVAAGQSALRPPGSRVTDVLFLARLQQRKRVMAFAEAARRLAPANPSVRFSVVGPDEGDLERLRSFTEANGLTGRLVYEGPLPPDAVRERLRRASIYVLPSVNEVFPVTVLEALDEGVPTVITESCGIAGDLRRLDAAEVIGLDDGALASALQNLIDDSDLRDRRSEAGRRAIAESFSIAPVVDRLVKLYGNSIPDSPRRASSSGQREAL